MWMKQKHVYRFWFYYTKSGRLGGKYIDYSIFLDDVYTLYTQYILTTPVPFLDIKVRFVSENTSIALDITHLELHRVEDQEYRQNIAGEKYGFEDDEIKLSTIAINTLHPENINHYLVNPYSMEMPYLTDAEIASIKSRAQLDDVVRSKLTEIKSETKEKYMKRVLLDQGASLAVEGPRDDPVDNIVYAEIQETHMDSRLRETFLQNFPQSSRIAFNRPDSCGSLPVYTMGPLMDSPCYDLLKRLSTGAELPKKPGAVLAGMSRQYLPPTTIKCKTSEGQQNEPGPETETVFVPTELYMGKNRERTLQLCYGTNDRDALDAYTEIAFGEPGIGESIKTRLDECRREQELARAADIAVYPSIFKCYDNNGYVKSNKGAQAPARTMPGMFSRRGEYVLASHGNKNMECAKDEDEQQDTPIKIKLIF